MTLRLNGVNSGFTEVKAPATAGSNTLTLPTSNGSANQYLKNGSTAGALEFANLPDLGYTAYTTKATTSGTTHTVTGLNTSHTHFIIGFTGVSVSSTGTPHLLAQLGNGTLSTSGYSSNVAYPAGGQQGASSSIRLTHTAYSGAANEYSGLLHILCSAGDAVTGNWILSAAGASAPVYGGFRWTGSTAIDRFSLQTSATAFDSGQFKIHSR